MRRHAGYLRNGSVFGICGLVVLGGCVGADKSDSSTRASALSARVEVDLPGSALTLVDTPPPPDLPAAWLSLPDPAPPEELPPSDMTPDPALPDKPEEKPAPDFTISDLLKCINEKKLVNDVSETVDCLPKDCTVALTMSDKSAQPACVVGGCYMPRIILSCGKPPPLMPSYMLCPVNGLVHVTSGRNNLELGRFDAGTKKLELADIEVPRDGTYKPLKDGDVVATAASSKNCEKCHITNNALGKTGNGGMPFNPLDTFGNKVNVRGVDFDLQKYVVFSNGAGKAGADGSIKLSDQDTGKEVELKPVKGLGDDTVCKCIKALEPDKLFKDKPEADQKDFREQLRTSQKLCAAFEKQFPKAFSP